MSGVIYFQNSKYSDDQFTDIKSYLKDNNVKKPYFVYCNKPDFDNKYLYGITNANDIEWNEFRESINKAFKKLLIKLKRGHDIILPYPSNDELRANEDIYFISNDDREIDIDSDTSPSNSDNEQKDSSKIMNIRHNLGVNILENKHLSYIQKQIDKLQHKADGCYIIDKVIYPILNKDELIKMESNDSSDYDDDMDNYDEYVSTADDSDDADDDEKGGIATNTAQADDAPNDDGNANANNDNDPESNNVEDVDDFKAFYDHYFYALNKFPEYYDKIKNYCPDLGILLKVELADLTSDVGIKRLHAKVLMDQINELKKENNEFNDWLTKLNMGAYKHTLQSKYIYTFALFDKKVSNLSELCDILGGNDQKEFAQILWYNLPKILKIHGNDMDDDNTDDTPAKPAPGTSGND